MPKKQHKHHYLYKTTNLVTEKFYYGMHSTSNLEDGYLGSGKRLKYSLNKYGRENHKIEYLKFFDSRRELILGEVELITEEVLNDPMCMNLASGGDGGHGAKFLTKEQLSKGGKVALTKTIKKLWADPDYRNMHSERFKKFHNEGKVKTPDWTGKNHTDETKKLMSEKAKARKPEQNSQFGTIWIHSPELKQNKKIKESDLSLYPSWIKGRKMKF